MYIDISFYFRIDEGEVVSYFVGHFSSHCVTAFDTAFGKGSDSGFHRDRDIFKIFCSQRGKPHSIQKKQDQKLLKLPF